MSINCITNEFNKFKFKKKKRAAPAGTSRAYRGLVMEVRIGIFDFRTRNTERKNA